MMRNNFKSPIFLNLQMLIFTPIFSILMNMLNIKQVQGISSDSVAFWTNLVLFSPVEEIALQFGKIATIMIRFRWQTLIIVKEEWMTSLPISLVALPQQAYSMDQYPTKVLSLRLQKRLLAVLTRSVVVAIYANNWNKNKIVNNSNRIKCSKQLTLMKNMLKDSK